MRKKCVCWTKSVRTALVVAVAIVSALAVTSNAQTTDPTAQPKLAFGDLSYVGGFRLPAQAANGDSFEFGGRQLTFNPVSNSLFVGSRLGRVAEVSIPNPVNSSNPAAMPFATYLQPFSDPTEGHLSQIAPDGVNLDGLLVYNNRLYGTASVFYDALNQQKVSHYSRSLQLNEPSFSGWSQVWDSGKTGFVSGTMSVIPSEWRALLGGPAATGQCCIPIVSRTSYGPAAFAFDPTKLGPTPAPATPLLYYTSDHTTLGAWDASNPTYGSTTFMGGMAIIAGTRTALYFGRNGMGENCYGSGTTDRSLIGTTAADGGHYCYDPTASDKGTHAYPYRYQVWAYDLNDFAAVKAGTKQPWEVKPYGVWALELPTPETTVRLGGVGYDPVTQRLYISQMYADKDGYAFRPVVHVIQINAAGGHDDSADPSWTSSPAPVTSTPSTTPSTVTPAPAPVTSTPTSAGNVVSAISLAVNRVAPQVAGTAITFSAFATGGVTPQEYKWLLDDGTGLKTLKEWSVVETFTWTPAASNPNYRVHVWARSAGNSSDAPEASASARFPITAPAPVPVRSVSIAADKPAPQVAGTSIKWTATADGGSMNEFKWLVHHNGTWSAVTGWTSQNTLTWTPATAGADYFVGVWVRSNGSTKDEAETSWSMEYPIIAVPVSAPAPTAPIVSGPVRSVVIAADKTSPQATGTAIKWTATADGGYNNQFKWLVLSNGTWTPVTGWSSQNTFTWTPATAAPDYFVGVWVRSNGSTKDEGEVTASADFAIVTAPVAVTPVAPVPVRSVFIAADKVAPQAPGATITWTATVDGGRNNEFKWLVYSNGNWAAVTGWSSQSTFNWTPASASPDYFVGVWVRSNGSTADEPEATWSAGFAIAAAEIKMDVRRP